MKRRPGELVGHDGLDELFAVCARHRKGDAFSFVATVHVYTAIHPKDEATRWPVLLAACKTAEAKAGPTLVP